VYDAATVKPTILQNRFYGKTSHDKEIRAYCKENGIHYESFWTLTGNPKLVEGGEVRELATKV
jgi:diketogulonate reductase-like aldo/keto reductase